LLLKTRTALIIVVVDVIGEGDGDGGGVRLDGYGLEFRSFTPTRRTRASMTDSLSLLRTYNALGNQEGRVLGTIQNIDALPNGIKPRNTPLIHLPRSKKNPPFCSLSTAGRCALPLSDPSSPPISITPTSQLYTNGGSLNGYPPFFILNKLIKKLNEHNNIAFHSHIATFWRAGS
jgi:hypothetical protein